MRRMSWSRVIYFCSAVALVAPGLALSAGRTAFAQQSTQQASPQQPIAYGQSVTGDLSTAQPEALYTFSAQAGDSIMITMNQTKGTLDPLVILVDQSQQTVLAVDNDSGGNHNALLRFAIPSAGSYVIRATAVQGGGDINGSYSLALALSNATPTPSDAANAPVIAPFKPGQQIRGDLNDTVRFHIYSLTAHKGDPITASLQIDDSANKVQAGLYLFSSGFQEITRAELGGTLNAKAPSDGVYFLMVARAASGTGTFTLSQATGPAGSTPILAPGQTARGTINADSAVKTYSLQGSSGQAITVRERRLSGNLAPYVYIVALDTGTTLTQAADQNGIAELTTTLPTSGSFAVVATRMGQQGGNTAGDFSLAVVVPGQVTPLPPAFQNYSPLQYGDTPNGNVDDTTIAVPYVFSADSGDTIQAIMTASDGSALDPYLILQNVNGDTLAEDDNSAGGVNARLQFTIKEGGVYALLAGRAGLADGKTSGKFDLAFETISPPQTASSTTYGNLLVAGQPQASVASPPIGSLYHFDAQANTAVSIDLTANGMDALTLVTDSDFNQIAAAQGSISSTLIARAGTYYVFVVRRDGPNQTAAGDFKITLQGTVNPAATGAPAALIYGQAVTGTISNDIYQLRYPFQATKGVQVTVTMNAGTGSTLDPMVGLVDAKNNLLGVNDDAAKGLKNASITVTIPEDGQYTVVATRSQEAQGTTQGAFTLKVDAATSQATSAASGNPATSATAAAATADVLPMRYGATTNAQIDAQHFLYYYTFQGTAGDVVTLRMNHLPGDSLDPVLYLYTYANGSPALVASNNDAEVGNVDAAIVEFALPQSGPYLIAATRLDVAKGQTTGSFVLTLEKD
jgi:hypothetical protein